MLQVLFDKPSAVALGNFDGLHKGHAAVINASLSYAKEGLVPLVLLFEPHPEQVIYGIAPAEIMTASLRTQELDRLGAGHITMPFTEIRSLPPRAFLEDILMKKLNARAVCCGYDYRFGYGGTGGVALLKELCPQLGLKISVVDAVYFNGSPISSTRIRAAVAAGEIEQANIMLGRAFSYDFEVVGGDRLGRLIGAPTINQLFPDGFAVPKQGVYASKTLVGDVLHASVTNIGVRPTIDGNILRSETCIADFSGDLYGRNVEVGLLKYIRAEAKFRSLKELSLQIETDMRQAVELFRVTGGV